MTKSDPLIMELIFGVVFLLSLGQGSPTQSAAC